MGASSACCSPTCWVTAPPSPRGTDSAKAVEEDDASKLTAKSRQGAKHQVIGQKTEASESHLAAHLHDGVKAKGAVQELLKNGIKDDRVCANFGDTELGLLVDTMECFQFSAGDTVVREGDVGTYFFVTETGSLEVSVQGKPLNTLGRGQAFGGLALLYNCPRTATVIAKEAARIWGANGDAFKKAMQENSQKHSHENRKYLDSMSMFDGLSLQQKSLLSETMQLEVCHAGNRVITAGETARALYFVKKGELSVYSGASVNAAGKVSGGRLESKLTSGDYFGQHAVIFSETHSLTVVADQQCELYSLGIENLREVLGDDLAEVLEQSFILQGLKKSPVMSQFSSTQQRKIVQVMDRKKYSAGQVITEGLRFALVVDGDISGITGSKTTKYQRGDWFEDDTMMQEDEDNKDPSLKLSPSSVDLQNKAPKTLTAGPQGAKLATLTKDGLGKALKELGIAAIGNSEQAMDYTRKMLLVKKVSIFRHLAQQQTNDLVRNFVLQKYKKGAAVITQGEMGTSLFVIQSGECQVLIGGVVKRTLSKNHYFGDRALLFDEPRSATIVVSSNKAELWSIDKANFIPLMGGKMKEELEHRIRLQDTNVSLKDLKHVKIVGSGAAGVVRLVQHIKTGTRYALKRVKKDNGKIPEEVIRECDLLAANDHPFVMCLVKRFETTTSVYMLTELITGGELHAAIRKVPSVLSRPQAQFYTGSLVLVLESLQDRNIVYRDLKPENVMLDAQGYLKLIDFGIAKKLEEGKSRTFTMIGTPHYMAPEVMRGHGYGTEVDIWSLGVMLFEFVCGYLPFADELDDPTEVCTAVLREQFNFPTTYRDQPGRQLMQGMLTRPAKKRLGTGINGYDDLKKAEFFQLQISDGPESLFQKIVGRKVDPPVVPEGECYTDPGEVEDIVLSDEEELYTK